MVKLKDYIKNICDAWENRNPVEIDFDIGLDANMEVNPKSENRIKFTLVYNGR